MFSSKFQSASKKLFYTYKKEKALKNKQWFVTKITVLKEIEEIV